MLFSSLEFYIFLAVTFALWRLTPAALRNWTLLAASYLFCAWWQPWFALVLLYCTVVSYFAGIRLQRSETATDEPPARFSLRSASYGRQAARSRRQERQERTARDCFSRPQGGPHSPLRSLRVLRVFAVKAFHRPLAALAQDAKSAKKNVKGMVLTALRAGRTIWNIRVVDWLSCPKGNPFPLSGFLRVLSVFAVKAFHRPLASAFALRATADKPLAQDAKSAKKDRQGRFFRPQGGPHCPLRHLRALRVFAVNSFSPPAGPPAFSFAQSARPSRLRGSIPFSICDFSAYMDMAVGTGRIFGIELSRNFDFPYLARSIGDFWRRWHITLTSWFRDYVYIPLGGNRTGARRWAINILVVFLVSGLWHGAAWTFVFWGGLHGLFYLAGRYSAPLRARLRRGLGLAGRAEAAWQVFATFQLVALAWVFFRARSIGDAFTLIGNMPQHLDWPVRMLASQFSTALAFGFALVFVGIELVHHWASRRNIDFVAAVPPVLRYPGYAAGLLATCLLGVSSHQFIYFQF